MSELKKTPKDMDVAPIAKTMSAIVPPNDATTEYVVKFICERPTPDAHLLPGVYSTAINVHNWSNGTIDFWWKVSISEPPLKHPEVSGGPWTHDWDRVRIGSDCSVEIDCKAIVDKVVDEFGPNQVAFKGFIVIRSQKDNLDVVAVYTAGKEDQVETIDIERVSPRKR